MNHFNQQAQGRPSRFNVAIIAALVVIAVVGCGPGQQADPNRAVVSGVVTYNGEPLPAGTISFESTDPPMASSALIEEGGKYSTNRVPIGACKVSVSTASVQYGNPSAYVAIPQKYGDVATSGLTAEIKPGENEKNFDLQP